MHAVIIDVLFFLRTGTVLLCLNKKNKNVFREGNHFRRNSYRINLISASQSSYNVLEYCSNSGNNIPMPVVGLARPKY